MSRTYVITALVYAIAGLLLGIYMAASKDHGQLVTHAHILLIGFLVSFAYALCHKLWLGEPRTQLARAQFAMHQFGTLVTSVGLFLLFGEYVRAETIDPILALASVAVLLGMIFMTVMVARAPQAA